MDSINKEHNIWSDISKAVGYVVLGIIGLALLVLFAIIAAIVIVNAVLLLFVGPAIALAGLLLVGIGIIRIFVIPRGSVISIGMGITLVGFGILVEIGILVLYYYIYKLYVFLKGRISAYTNRRISA